MVTNKWNMATACWRAVLFYEYISAIPYLVKFVMQPVFSHRRKILTESNCLDTVLDNILELYSLIFTLLHYFAFFFSSNFRFKSLKSSMVVSHLSQFALLLVFIFFSVNFISNLPLNLQWCCSMTTFLVIEAVQSISALISVTCECVRTTKSWLCMELAIHIWSVCVHDPINNVIYVYILI